MIRFHGRPFLAYLLDQLKDQGITDLVILTGYLAEQIEDYFGDGSSYGMHISYAHSPVEAETGQRLLDAAHLIAPNFLMLYCDNLWPMQLAPMWQEFQQSQAMAMITVYNNRDGYTRNNVKVDENQRVKIYDHRRTTPGLNGVEIGYAILRKKVLDYLPKQNVRFEHTVYPALVSERMLHAYQTDHRYYSVGSHERLPLTEAFLSPQRAVILDRDGVLNRRPPQAQYVRCWDEFHWLPDVKEALSLLKRAGYKLLVVTNQPGIARNMMTEADLESIHSKMRSDLLEAGVTIDAIYHCPHGWDEGCFCRKPQPGMLFQAQREHHLDLTRTLFIGDDERDMQAGQAAGCPSVLVCETHNLLAAVKSHPSLKEMKVDV